MEQHNQNPEDTNDDNRFFKTLSSQLYRWDCPSPSQLGDYQLDLLDGQAARTIQTHLTECLRCTEELAILKKFLEDSDQTAKEDSSQSQRLYFPTYSYGAVQSISSTRGDESNLKKFTFETNDGLSNITLFIGQNVTDTGYTLTGQLDVEEALEDIIENATIELFKDDQLVAVSQVDEFGTLSAMVTVPSPYLFKITLQNNDILFGKINL